MGIFKRLQELFLKIIKIVSERFFLVSEKGASPFQPSSLSEEGWKNGVVPPDDESIEKRNACHVINQLPEYENGFDTASDIPPYLNTQHISLCETLDRILNTGVAVYGDITISVANIDLICIGLNAILSSVETIRETQKE